MNSKTILNEENIVKNDGRRNKKRLLEEMKNEGYMYIKLFNSQY